MSNYVVQVVHLYRVLDQDFLTKEAARLAVRQKLTEECTRLVIHVAREAASFITPVVVSRFEDTGTYTTIRDIASLRDSLAALE